MPDATAPVAPRLRARDLVDVAVFAVIYLVLLFAINMLGYINPVVMLVVLLASIIVCCIPYMLFLARTRRPGKVALFGLVIGLVSGVSGLGWITAALCVVLGVAADLIMRSGGYRSRRAAIWACVVFSLWFIGPMIPLLLDRGAYLTSPEMAGSGDQYIADFDRIVTTQVVWGYNLATLVCALLGALLGSAVLRKHFLRAGLA